MEEPKSKAKRGAKTAAAAQEDRITLLPLSELHDFPDHPFKVRDDEAMQETAESIRQYGVLVPAIVRPREDGGYEIIAGHRRRHGSELAGLSAMPCIVRQMDDDTATILMVDSNIQRENILPSERAQAYKMKLEAIRRKAGRPAKTEEKTDENTVRRIFAMRAAGTGFRAIAVTLNEEGVLPPGALYYQRKGRSDPRNVNHKWAETTVKALIRSEVYIGNMVQGKTGTLSYKSRKLINKPEEEWIRVEGTHEPIISREVWDTVVSIDKKKVRKTPPTDGIRSIFTGLVYCADCGFKMRNHIERFTYKDGTPGRYSSFICGNYARSGKSACTIHSIYENVLEELVLTDIREKARFVECDGERLAEQISRMKEKESRSRVLSYEQELKAAAARMIELERLMQNLYEDKCTGTIPQTVFQTLMRKYETERAEKAAAIPELEQKVRAQLENRQDANRWMEVIRRYTEITALDESILFELVDRIEVGEARKVNGQRICDVKVVYRYVGSVDDALAQERQEAYEKAI